MAKPIHQELVFDATPQQVFDALVDSKLHAAFTGAPATLGQEPGQRFECYDHALEGCMLELVPGERIVQAWRVTDWPAGLYTVVHLELSAVEGGTKLVMDHHGVPDDFEPHIDGGWHTKYWNPLKAYFAAKS